MQDEAKTSFRLPRDLLKKAQEKAKRLDLTLSQVLRALLRKWVEEDDPQQ